jgi:hypothetical protein
MPDSPPDNSDDDKPASTYFEWERRSISNPEKKGEGDVSSLPSMPASSPWGLGPGPGAEACRRSLVREMLTTPSEEKAAEIRQMLVSLIGDNYWPSWQVELPDEVEAWAAELQSRRVC